MFQISVKVIFDRIKQCVAHFIFLLPQSGFLLDFLLLPRLILPLTVLPFSPQSRLGIYALRKLFCGSAQVGFQLFHQFGFLDGCTQTLSIL